jgi:hypothetical protein
MVASGAGIKPGEALHRGGPASAQNHPRHSTSDRGVLNKCDLTKTVEAWGRRQSNLGDRAAETDSVAEDAV